jgi:hypothetical protein
LEDGVSKIPLFSKAPVAKNIWRLIQGTCLWIQEVREKYIAPNTGEDWNINLLKQQNNASVIWKVIIYAFYPVDSWLIWEAGKWDKVQIGLDP